jgi:prepilin-type N-terminal cleavage/methylation domain-containing protein
LTHVSAKSRSTRRDTQGGFTLVELMISLVIFSVAVAGILAVAVSLTQGFREQRQAINAQDAVRTPIDLIADALRQASPGVQDPTKIYDSWACATAADPDDATGAIRVTNSTTGSDRLDIIYGAGGVVTTATGDINTASAGSVAVMDGTGLAAGDFVLLTQDYLEGYVVKLSAATANSITWIAASSGCFPKSFAVATGTITVIRVQHASFFVSNDASNNNMPTLWMDPDADGAAEAEPLAEGIEDMQVVVGIDDVTVNGALLEGTPTLQADEWRGNHASDVAFDATAGLPRPTTAPTLQVRAVRVTLIARTTATEHGNLNTYNKPASEDRTTVGAADQYRRRVLKTVVDIRNASGSPGT